MRRSGDARWSESLFAGHCRSVGAIVAVLLLAAAPAAAQMTTIGTPFRSVSNSFFESVNMGWSVRGPNFFANFGGGGNAAAPAFGGFNPNAGIQSGFSFGGGPFSGGLTFGAAQGSSSSFTSATPLLTTMNGQPGSLTFGRQQPFVTSVVPIVGAGGVAYAPIVSGVPVMPQLSPLDPQLPWQQKLSAQGGLRRSASLGDGPGGRMQADRILPDRVPGAGDDRAGLVDPLPPTRAEREREQAAQAARQLASANTYFEKGLEAERNRKPGVAKLYFEMARRRGDETIKEEVARRLKALAENAPQPARVR